MKTKFFSMVFALALFLPPAGMPSAGPDDAAKVIQARDKLQRAWNAWDVEAMKAARDQFLGLVMQGDGKNADLFYYAALGEYRLTIYAFAVSKHEEAAQSVGQAEKYLEKTMELRPEWGEPYALYATLLGYEMAMHPDKAMELGMKSFALLGQAEMKGPLDPRVRMLRGLSLFYTPAQYGGGPDKAVPILEQAVDLFEKEHPSDPVKPTWGLEETLTFLAMAHQQSGKKEAAVDCLKKALAANPDYLLAQQELKKLQQEK